MVCQHAMTMKFRSLDHQRSTAHLQRIQIHFWHVGSFGGSPSAHNFRFGIALEDHISKNFSPGNPPGSGGNIGHVGLALWTLSLWINQTYFFGGGGWTTQSRSDDEDHRQWITMAPSPWQHNHYAPSLRGIRQDNHKIVETVSTLQKKLRPGKNKIYLPLSQCTACHDMFYKQALASHCHNISRIWIGGGKCSRETGKNKEHGNFILAVSWPWFGEKPWNFAETRNSAT